MIDLKNITQELHDEVEKCYYPKMLFQTQITKEEYCDYLQIFLLLHNEIESQFDNFIKEWNLYEFDYASYKRADLLDMDLKNLDCITQEVKNEAPILIENFGQAVGFLYVLTGSTMGGMLLSSKVEQSNALKDFQSINNYFLAFGELTMPKWQNFVQFMRSYLLEKPQMANEVANGAKQCFSIIIKRLNNGKYIR